ncbi:MAG: N-formylglutamate amidohydrolase [Rudanella sp.]|nr:N-formylglutamate amidohydrolase [Rudanella sp.]
MKHITTLLLLLSAACQTSQSTQGPVPQPGTPGATAVTGYVSYQPGQLPIVLSAPHGGSLKPAIPDRNCTGCVYVQDANTLELSQTIDSVLFVRFGCHAHLIINRLHRQKLDPNRDITDGADGQLVAQQAWHQYHQYLDSARRAVSQRYGRGLLLDLHGHGHTIQRIELGYLLQADDLRLSDSQLDVLGNRSSIASLTRQQSLSRLLRSSGAFGTLLHQAGYPAIPSAADPAPKTGESYFDGGYITQQYGSAGGGSFDAIQLEHNMSGLRDTPANRLRYAQALADVLDAYWQRYYVNRPLREVCR